MFEGGRRLDSEYEARTASGYLKFARGGTEQISKINLFILWFNSDFEFLIFSAFPCSEWSLIQAWSLSNDRIDGFKVVFFVKYVVFSRTCVLSGTALVPFLTTSERCEGWKAWGLSTTVTITCMFVSQWNAPEKWSSYAYFLLPDGPWQIRRSEIEIMLNHMVCFPPNHVYSPALHMLFFSSNQSCALSKWL